MSVFFVRIQPVFWSTNIFAKYLRIHLQWSIIAFWFIHWISLFDHNIFSYLFLIFHWIPIFDHQNIKKLPFIFSKYLLWLVYCLWTEPDLIQWYNFYSNGFNFLQYYFFTSFLNILIKTIIKGLLFEIFLSCIKRGISACRGQ